MDPAQVSREGKANTPISKEAREKAEVAKAALEAKLQKRKSDMAGKLLDGIHLSYAIVL